MARTILFITLVGIIGGALLIGINGTEVANASAQTNSADEEWMKQVLKGTVQITMVSEEVEETLVGSTDKGTNLVLRQPITTLAHGLGTLIDLDGATVLVTHNHWPQVTGSTRPDRVLFFDANGKSLLEMDGVSFQNQFLYRDGGTLVLQAPAELKNKLVPFTDYGESQSVTSEDSVHILRRQPDSSDKVEFITAEVTDNQGDGLHSVMTLRSDDGQSIVVGDSGGGIFSNGMLVGNMWMTIEEEWRYPGDSSETKIVSTDRSRAAGLTPEMLEMVGKSLAATEEVANIAGDFVMN